MLSETIQGLKVSYKIQKGKSDRKHLLIIFSGFRAHGAFDFGGNELKNISSEIIWIDDNFNGFYSYYMLANGGHDISSKINLFIEGHLERLGISKEECTLAGFSKGGSAALYYLANYGYMNAVVKAPQFKIASYIKNESPREIPAMFGSEDSELFKIGDSMITNAIASDIFKNKNVYLYTSVADIHYETEILPNLNYLETYQNFNYVVSETPLVRQHDDVTRYNIPTIVSLLSLLCDGIAPRFGAVINGRSSGNSVPYEVDIQSVTAVSSIHKLSYSANKLFIEGDFLFRGIPSPDYRSQKTEIIFDHELGAFTIPLGQDKNNLINSRNYEESFVDYSHSKFATLKYQGINLDYFPYGKSQLSIHSTHTVGVMAKISKYTVGKSSDVHFTDKYVVNTLSEKENVYILKRPYDELDNLSYEFRLDQFEVKYRKLFIKGLFAPKSFNFSDWSSIRYKIRFEVMATGKAYIYPLANASRPYESMEPGEQYYDKSKAYLATKSYKGLDLSKLINGIYSVTLIANFGSHVITHLISEKIEIDYSSAGKKKSVAVIGSCVSRDLFNSRLSPGWKDYMNLGPEFYQMSMISLMASPVAFDENDFLDLSRHDFLATKNDFSKSFLDEIKSDVPDNILIDLFADSRFDVINVGNSFVTDNLWKIGKSHGYERMVRMRRISPIEDSDEYYELFERSCIKFKDYLSEHCPDTRIILNSCRASLTWQSLCDNGAFNSKAIKTQNLRWARLEKIFIRLFQPDIIDTTTLIIAGDPDHPWGRGPVHYESRFYQTVSSELFSKIHIDDSNSNAVRVIP
ncbi:DUF6270 domain-containing protein [Glutamicibacter ardleyensis]|uniref:DUF6270 domain-containing protein n=1 Tax=Glutamicibacter ardleyensis TaxID=225894 RepID=UPI003FD026B0